MAATVGNWWREFPGERFLARMLVANSVLVLIAALQDRDRSLIAYCFLRFFVYISAEVIYFLRRRRDFYLPLVQELNDRAYWSTALLILFLIKLAFLDKFIEPSPWSRMFSLVAIATIFISLLMQLQSQEVIREEKEARERKLRILLGKASISERELEIIKPKLLQIAVRNQRSPLRWRLIATIVSLVLASVLSAYSVDVADYFESKGIEFPGVLPPD